MTSRTLISIIEQKRAQRQPAGDLHKFGGIITYFPIARLSDYHVGHYERLGVLSLHVQAPHGAAKLELLFPSDREKAVFNTAQWAFPESQ